MEATVYQSNIRRKNISMDLVISSIPNNNCTVLVLMLFFYP